jgi:hypothetical protein
MAIKRSSPSYRNYAFDVPEPESFSGEFVYNYFLKDERVTTNTSSDAAAVLRHGGHPARKVVLKFSALDSITNIATTVLTTRSESIRFTTLKSLASTFTSEVEVQSERTCFVAVQDDDLAEQIQADIDSYLLLQKASQIGLSPLEAVLKYGSVTSDRINTSDILETTNIEAQYNLTYYDPATGEDITVQKQGGVSEYAVGGFYNRKFVHDILLGSENTPFSPLWGTVDPILPDASRIQTEAISVLDSNRISMADYEFSVEPVEPPVALPAAAWPNAVEICGYLIEKYEVLEDGSNKRVAVTGIASLTGTQMADENVVYGKTYLYKIKSVFYLTTTLASASPTNVFLVGTYLISSRGSPYITVTCNETVPPPPPSNIQFFLTMEQELMMIWDMPFNKQEDIKRYQIFRRSSLEEPYTIIAEIDFDDSEVLTERAEFIPDYSKIASDRQRTDYTDTEFEFDTEYYYAICSVDAHDYSSPYSSQFKVVYDRIDGKMDTQLVGFAGAPKAYPNFTLKETLIVDCIKDSGHEKMKVYFDPECLVLRGATNQNDAMGGTHFRMWENYLETNSGVSEAAKPMYKLQIINLDRQQDQKLDIYLKRSSDLDNIISEQIPGDGHSGY